MVSCFYEGLFLRFEPLKTLLVSIEGAPDWIRPHHNSAEQNPRANANKIVGFFGYLLMCDVKDR